LTAQYSENDFGNFTNKIYINLGQNLRYNIPNVTYVKESFAIPNLIINDDNVIYNITDHFGNLWTGGDEMVAQTVHHETGEEIFLDIKYNVFNWAVKNNNIFNFNISTDESIAEFVKSNILASMIRLQLF
jgi:hypothetical protein